MPIAIRPSFVFYHLQFPFLTLETQITIQKERKFTVDYLEISFVKYSPSYNCVKHSMSLLYSTGINRTNKLLLQSEWQHLVKLMFSSKIALGQIPSTSCCSFWAFAFQFILISRGVTNSISLSMVLNQGWHLAHMEGYDMMLFGDLW